MKKFDKEKASRRNFLTKGMKAGTSFLAGLTPLIKEEGEKVRMLTPDGKVVLVDKSKTKTPNKKTRNEDILNWMDNPSQKVKK